AEAQDLLNRQYISTCNSFDADLKALRSSIRDAGDAIMHVKSAKLPPIKIDQSVLRMASFEGSLDDLSLDDNASWNSIADVLLEALNVSREELQASQKLLNKQMAQYVKTETKREEVGRILETTASAVASPNATIDGGLNPLQRDYQLRLKSSYDAIGKRISDVEEAVNAHADRIERSIRELPHSLRAPSAESVERMLHNVTQTLAQKNYELDEITECVESLKIGKSAEYAKAKLRSSDTPAYVPPPPMRRTGSVSASAASAAAPRTAAQGTPWSPKDLPFNTAASSSIRKSGRFGLRAEDLLIGDEVVTPKTPAVVADRLKDDPKSAMSPGGTRTHPLFPHVQVRELVPRSLKTNRKASIALDEPAPENAGALSSEFSSAALYVQARQQRSMVRNLLTRPTRVAPVVCTAKPSAEDAGNVSLMAPMPNLERYIEAFGKLKVARRKPTPEPTPEPEPEPEPKTEPEAKPVAAVASKWRCPLCMIDNPPSVSFCLACETENPNAPAAAATASKPAPVPAFAPVVTSSSVPSFGGGFKPTGGASLFGSISGSASGGMFGASASFASTGQSAKLPFTSFVPPPGAPPLSGGFKPTVAPASFGEASATANTSTAAAASGAHWKCDTCYITNPPTVKICRACETPNPNNISASLPAASAAAATTSATVSTPVAVAPSGDWKCDTCFITNPPTVKICRACETPNPKADAAPAPASTSTFPAFGGGFKPTVSFGTPSSSTLNTGFSFGGSGTSIASAAMSQAKPQFTMSSFEPPRSVASVGDEESYDETEDDGYSATDSQHEYSESDLGEQSGSASEDVDGYDYNDDVYSEYSAGDFENYEAEDAGDEDVEESDHDGGSVIGAADKAAVAPEDSTELEAKAKSDDEDEDKPEVID
ncbi:hypothetical protein LPJ75_003533, partial [Coemansia sp. RSA 2598]